MSKAETASSNAVVPYVAIIVNEEVRYLFVRYADIGDVLFLEHSPTLDLWKRGQFTATTVSYSPYFLSPP